MKSLNKNSSYLKESSLDPNVLLQHKKNIYNLLDAAVRKDPPDAVLLSWWIDSSVLAYLWKKYNPQLIWITVVSEDTISPDQHYATLVAEKLWLNHKIVVLKKEEVDALTKKVVLSLWSFNMYWISASLVLYKWLEFAKQMGFHKVATGEWSDDLFWSFPVMLNWEFGNDTLKDFINNRILDIDLMTEKVSESNGINVVLPYHDVELKDYVLKMPINLRNIEQEDWNIITKYLLRQAFVSDLPSEVIYRPQTMAFTWASTLDVLHQQYANTRSVADLQKQYNLNIDSPLQAYLFEVLVNANKYTPILDGQWPSCLFCKSKLRTKESVHCVVCWTLQYNNKVLNF